MHDVTKFLLAASEEYALLAASNTA